MVDQQLQPALALVIVDVEPVDQAHVTIRQRRRLVSALEIEGDGIEAARAVATDDERGAQAKVEETCDRLLANPVIESYEVTVS